MMNKKIFFLFFLVSRASVIGASGENFIIKKKTSESALNLSKDAIKERMGDAVRDGLHLLFDNAENLLSLQKKSPNHSQEVYTLHERIIGLERKFSRIAESLIENHFVYKKNHKKRLNDSLETLQQSVTTLKSTCLQLKDSRATEKDIASVNTELTSMNDKIATDICLKNI